MAVAWKTNKMWGCFGIPHVQQFQMYSGWDVVHLEASLIKDC